MVGNNLIRGGLEKFQGQPTCFLFRNLLVPSRARGQNLVIWIQDAHCEDPIMWRAFHSDLLVPRRHMVGRLEQTQQLVLVVRIFRNDLNKVNVFLDNLNQKVITDLEASADFLLLIIQCSDPGLKHRAHDPQIVSAVANLLHVSTQNNPGTQANFLGELSELFVVDNTTENPRQESFALPRIPFGQIGGHAETEDSIAEELKLLVVVFS